MYDGYFALGGMEIGNSPRAVGLQDTADCPISWLDYRHDNCETLYDALGHDPYVYQTIDTAPWYDPDDADRSSRIYGLNIITMSGLQDDTRQATMLEKVTKGAHIGRTRRAGRQVRVTAMLSAQGEDALDAGMTWLRGALDAKGCGAHGSACQVSDFEFFTSCPPARPTTETYTAYTESRRNMIAYPVGPTATGTSGYNPANNASLAWDNTAKAIRVTAVAGGNPASGVALHDAIVGYVPGVATYTMSLEVIGEVADEWELNAQGSWVTSAVISTPVPVGVGQIKRLSITFTTNGNAKGAIYLLRKTGGIASRVLMRKVLFEKVAVSLPWFDGATDPNDRRNWAPNPALTTNAGLGQAGGGQAPFAWATDTGIHHSGSTSQRKDISGSGQTGFQMEATGIPPGPVRWSAWVRSSRAGSVHVYAEGNLNGSYYGFDGHPTDFMVDVPANTWTLVEGFGTLPYGTLANQQFGFYGLAVQAGDQVWVDDFLVEQVREDLGPYFDGDTPDTASFTYGWVGTANNSSSTALSHTTEPAWTGAANASPSVLNIRGIENTPVTDQVYADLVDRYRRYLHDVKVISGPYVVREIKSRKYPDMVANIVEFTIGAEVPEIFTKPREVVLAPSAPSVINDVPFNFVLQPRPVNAITPKVVAIKNLETNPSLETDATGWSGSVASVSGAAPGGYFTNGRVTGELAAVGAASYRGRMLGNGSTSASGRARMTTFAPDVTLENVNQRVSFNVWAAAVSVGGATGAALVSVTVKCDWRTAGGLISTTTIGTSTSPADIAGKAWTLVNQKPPATAVIARVYVEHVVDWSSSATPASNSDIRGYVDAVAVTVP